MDFAVLCIVLSLNDVVGTLCERASTCWLCVFPSSSFRLIFVVHGRCLYMTMKVRITAPARLALTQRPF